MKINIREFLYLSNLLSLSRILLTIPICYLIQLNTPTGNVWLLIVALFTGFTDYLDGYFSRRYNQITDLGIVLDPIADKISMAGIMIYLILYRDFPISLTVLLIYRDILISIGGSLVIRKTGEPIMANMLGKVNTCLISAAGILNMAGVQNWIYYGFLIASYSSVFISAVIYYRMGEKILMEEGAGQRWFWRIALLSISAVVVYYSFAWENPAALPVLEYFNGLK